MTFQKRQLYRAAAFAVALLLPVASQAAKEKFERNKPHVNVGTIGHVDHGRETLSFTLSVLGLPGGDDSTTVRGCKALLDIRLLYADDLGGAPYFERRGVELQRNGSLTIDATPSSPRDPSVPLLHQVEVKAENIDGVRCIFRGAVEVRDTVESRTTRLFPLRPEDFIALGRPRPDSGPPIR